MIRHAIFNFDNDGIADAREVYLRPCESGGFAGHIQIPFRLFDESDTDWTLSSNQIHTETQPWLLDLNDSAIDLVNRKGGRIDGQVLLASQTYLVWAFLDRQLGFQGIGLTRKPYSTFSAISDGSAAKGATGKVFTVPGFFASPSHSGFQFTLGARVVVRNAVGTAPLYEWNWATVTAVADTSVTLTMDNVTAYGTAITGVTTGEILQWNMFRPYFVQGIGHVLYGAVLGGNAHFYNLLGELPTDSGSLIKNAYTSAQEWRDGIGQLFSTGAGTPFTVTDFSCGRFFPLWSSRIVGRVVLSATTGVNTVACFTWFGLDIIFAWAQVATFSNENTGLVDLKAHAITTLRATNTGQQEFQILGYYSPGGMRT